MWDFFWCKEVKFLVWDLKGKFKFEIIIFIGFYLLGDFFFVSFYFLRFKRKFKLVLILYLEFFMLLIIFEVDFVSKEIFIRLDGFMEFKRVEW